VARGITEWFWLTCGYDDDDGDETLSMDRQGRNTQPGSNFLEGTLLTGKNFGRELVL